MLQNTVLNTGSSVIYFFCQWLTTVLAVRLADFETAGIYSLAISFTNLFYFLALFGIRNYQISDVDRRFSEGQYFGARIVAMLAAAACFWAACLAGRLAPRMIACYGAYMLFKLEEAYTEGYFPLLQLREEYRTLALSYAAKGIVPAAAFAASLSRTQDLLAAILWMTGGYALCVLTLDVPKLLRMGLQRPRFAGCLAILRNCVPLMLVTLSTPVMNYVTRNAVGQMLNERLLGQYASLSSVIVVMSTFAGAVFVVFIPQVSRWKGTGQWGRVWNLCMVSSAGMLAVGLLAMLAGKLLGPWVCVRIFGEGILESIALLLPLLITSTVLMVKSFYSAMLIPLGQRWELLAGECSGAIVCALTAVPLTKRLGLQGANLSYLLGVLVQTACLAGGVFWTIRSNEKNV